jgi:hypothetical protein
MKDLCSEVQLVLKGRGFSPAVILIESLTARLKARPFKTIARSAIYPQPALPIHT